MKRLYCVLVQVSDKSPVLVHHCPFPEHPHYSREMVGTLKQAKALMAEMVSLNFGVEGVSYTLCLLKAV